MLYRIIEQIIVGVLVLIAYALLTRSASNVIGFLLLFIILFLVSVEINFIKLRKIKLVSVLSVIIFFFVIAFTMTFLNVNTTVPNETTPTLTSSTLPEIKITHPLNDKVNLLEDIHGTAKNIQEGDEIWVFVYSYSDNNYYLIGENVTLHNERWSINRQIGADNENGAEFDIVAVLADKVAQDKYNYYFKEKGVTAMSNVTDVVEVYDQITVTRM